jgi:predicted nucleic acid-binding protein
MSIVCNASLLINLSRIGKLDLLHDLYNELVIPEGVWQEVVVEGAGQAGAELIGSAVWIKKQAVKNRELVQALQQELDAGESEAVALSLEMGAELLLMDEHLGREVARHFGLRYSGLIGILIEAKHKGLISAIKPFLDLLRNVAGFRVSDVLYVRKLEGNWKGEWGLGN